METQKNDQPSNEKIKAFGSLLGQAFIDEIKEQLKADMETRGITDPLDYVVMHLLEHYAIEYCRETIIYPKYKTKRNGNRKRKVHGAEDQSSLPATSIR